MKKNKYLYFALAASMAVASCKQEPIKPEAPATTTPTPPSKGTADFTKFVAIGNSLTAGYQAGALFTEGQANSLPKILSTQFSLAQGATLAFNQPDINSDYGYYGTAGPIILGRLILYDADGVAGPKTPAPAPAGTPGMPAPYSKGGDLPAPFTGDKAALNNFGVPGIQLGQVLTPLTGGPSSGNPAYNGLYARFATNPGTSTILGDALATQPTFFLFDLGNNDVLGYAVGGGSNPAIFTSESTFTGYYTTAINTILGSNANLKGVIVNIPDVTTIPYFTTVTWNAITLDAATATTVTTSLANNYNGFLDAMKTAGVITQAEFDKRKLTYVAGKNGVLISDETLTDLTAAMNANGAAALVPYAQARQATATDLIPLSAGSILGTIAPNTNNTGVYGVSFPVGDAYALIPTETTEIKARTTAFNATIAAAAAGSNNRIALADVNAAFTALVTAKAGVYNGVTITPSFAPPTGAFSEDGVHPNSRGYAFMANIIIDAINAKFTAAVPKADISKYKGTALPINKP